MPSTTRLDACTVAGQRAAGFGSDIAGGAHRAAAGVGQSTNAQIRRSAQAASTSPGASRSDAASGRWIMAAPADADATVSG